MDFPALDVDAFAHAWTGRNDGDGDGHRRWWQAVEPWPGTPETGAARPPQPERPTTEPPHAEQPACPAVILGFRSDEGVRRNHGRRGAASAPAEIRSALGSLAFHAKRPVYDAGDIVVGVEPDNGRHAGGEPDGGHAGAEANSGDDAGVEPESSGVVGDAKAGGPAGDALAAGQRRAGAAITALLDAGALPVVFGGGHETAFASYLGVSASKRIRDGARLGVLNLDAHFDLRNAPVPSSGTPFLQMAHAEAAAGRTLNYAVVGISEPNNTRALFDTADRLDVKYLPDEECTEDRTREFVESFLATVDAVYLTIDLDVMPASVAPGVSAPAAFGVPLPVIVAICGQVAASGKLFHADLAELNPDFDVDSRTAMVAARLVHTLLR
ncbi:arginase family protein [Paenarthrobacter sp. Z7-10]|uniref:arginase family protein n=1 Tax=Paenarthrobacter sp. Z7-10 TaxID=2787635 RepID=UPI0022A942C7|nr:arginase family protein [Paenarthrobacter sp. Z7-10]MCZ2403356.1 arginase family protein [Paenarthrobacter sp. Z7-10]